MRLIAGFFKLIRLPNLLFIALTQVLFQYCIFYSFFTGEISSTDSIHFIFLVFASVFIAAGGYIINDYFDINIDEVNKPGRMVVDKLISRRWAIAWHFMFSSAGILCTVLAVPFFQKWYLILANIFCVALLWLYSTNFKKQLLVGNIVISVLTSWTILIIFFSKVSVADAFGLGNISYYKFFRVTFLYGGFAFIVSLIREAVKDMEDMPGDEKYGCKTMPITWGVNAAKVYVAVWLVVLLAMLIVLQVYVLQFGWWMAVTYVVLIIILPLGYIFYKLFFATAVQHFHQLSTWIKWVMLAGILSMVFFYFYQ